MKKITMIVLMIMALPSFAADRDRARQITQQLNNFVTPSQSTTPNKALLYRSSRDNVDDTTVETGNTMAIGPTSVKITRGEALALSRCTSDFGTANLITEAGVPKIEILTTRVPLRVLCSTADGAQRAFYVTYQE